VELRPIDKASDKEPDYRVVQERDGVIVEFGAAWKRSSGKDRDFLSVLLDDPALPASLNAALFLSDRDDRRRSFGSDRPRRRRPQSLNRRIHACGDPPPHAVRAWGKAADVRGWSVSRSASRNGAGRWGSAVRHRHVASMVVRTSLFALKFYSSRGRSLALTFLA
jgi:uncharacterized protein (DUF736 family)